MKHSLSYECILCAAVQVMSLIKCHSLDINWDLVLDRMDYKKRQNNILLTSRIYNNNQSIDKFQCNSLKIGVSLVVVVRKLADSCCLLIINFKSNACYALCFVMQLVYWLEVIYFAWFPLHQWSISIELFVRYIHWIFWCE